MSKLERSRVVKDEQLENILLIFVTFEVSKRERSREVKDLQPENMPPIHITCEVLICSSPSMLLRDWKN